MAPHAATPRPDDPAASLVLIGLRASGKSTVGRRVAARLSRTFVDLDDRTPALLGVGSAADAINLHGLGAFRDAERAALEEALAECAGAPAVLALGGGTPTAPGATKLMRDAQSRGVIRVVYLHATPGVLRDRLSATDTTTRPSLTGADLLDEVETIYLQRDPLYRGLADAVLESDGGDQERLVNRVAELAI